MQQVETTLSVFSPVKDTVVTNDRWGNDTRCTHGSFLTCEDSFDPGKIPRCLPHVSCLLVSFLSTYRYCTFWVELQLAKFYLLTQMLLFIGQLLPRKWENCLTVDMNSWGYRRDMVLENVRTAAELIEALTRAVRFVTLTSSLSSLRHSAPSNNLN